MTTSRDQRGDRGEPLLPCPFCGNEAVYAYEGQHPEAACYARCLGCDATTMLVFEPAADSESIVREKWNRRTNDTLLYALQAADFTIRHARIALDDIWAAIGDRLLAKGPLAKEYAHGVLRNVEQAQQSLNEHCRTIERALRGEGTNR